LSEPKPTRTPALRHGGRELRKIPANRRIDFIVQNLNLGVTGMKMLLDGVEVDVIAYVVTEETGEFRTINGEQIPIEEYLIEPIAVFVDDALEARLTELPPPEEGN